jgi:prephenate dehydrogenase
MPSNPPPSETLIDHVVIAGVGLIGGSIAQAVKQRGLARKVTGLGRNRERLEAARSAGVVDDIATSAAELQNVSLAIVCTPVDRIADDVRAIQQYSPQALITDAGSVKGAICRALADVSNFVGSHPMAGSERGGWEHSRADLFEGKVCAITPLSQPESRIARVEAFWQVLGMRTQRVTPPRHDELVALTSHLPHAVAAVLASQLTADARPLASTGFRDTTRVASGDPELWTAIFRDNRRPVAASLRELILQLEQFAGALDDENWLMIHDMLLAGRSQRDEWLHDRPDLVRDSGSPPS